MDYYELRRIASRIIPGMLPFDFPKSRVGAVKEKGRKSNYQQFSLKTGQWEKKERLLNTEEIKSFVEISIRAAACPMPLNVDCYDGLLCGFGCKYCFADAFRASLYTSFFDNSKNMGIRHCNVDMFKAELDKAMKFRGSDPREVKKDIHKAIAMSIPMRFGIRFEDFLPIERKKGVSLALLRYLADAGYPTMINTKSDLVGEDDYIEALASNPAKAAVHITMISSDSNFLKMIEPGAPSFERRIAAAKRLSDAGIRVVARIEPFMIHLNDSKDQVEEYMERIEEAGIRHLTFDTYSYSANNPGIRRSFEECGIDFQRMFTLMSDSQGVGSLLLSSFMQMFRDRGFSCSSFDMGGVPTNSDPICCEVGDWFNQGDPYGFNYGSIVIAARFISQRGKRPTRWIDFENYVNARGGFLSEALYTEVKQLWNVEGNHAYAVNWADGIEPYGRDEDGMVWRKMPTSFREKTIKLFERLA